MFVSFTRKQEIVWNGETSDNHCLGKGIRQGESLSAILFNIYMDKVTEFVRSGHQDSSFSLNGLYVLLLKYAGDLVFISPSELYLRKSIRRFAEFADLSNLVVNMNKSYTMIVRGNKHVKTEIKIFLNDVRLEQMQKFNGRLSLTKYAHDIYKSPVICFSVCQKTETLPSGSSFDLAEKIFETTVGSICIFGGELVAMDKSVGSFWLKFLTFIFDYRSSTPNDALYFLTEEFSLHIRQINPHLNFIEKILERSLTFLQYKALTEAITKSKSQKFGWFLERSIRLKISLKLTGVVL